MPRAYVYKLVCVSHVRSGHGEVRSPIIGSGFAVSVVLFARVLYDLPLS